MRPILVIFFILAGASLFAQTKKIAFKSHSGNAGNFNTALENELFDMDNSNFGQGPQMDIKTAQLDSVIFVSDSEAIMITSTYCTMRYEPKEKSRLWNEGKQIVYHHPLFSRQHSLDSIKNVIREKYNFKNPVEKVVFIGYDNEEIKDEDGNNKAVTFITRLPDNNQSSSHAEFAIILGLIFGLSSLGGLVAWKYIQWREKKIQIDAIASI
jgi:hypothetical protein